VKKRNSATASGENSSPTPREQLAHVDGSVGHRDDDRAALIEPEPRPGEPEQVAGEALFAG